MIFTELNTIENFIINKLSGVNLNTGEVNEPTINYTPAWIYKQASELNRESSDVLIEKDVYDALIRLNPAIEGNPDFAHEVIHKLKGIQKNVFGTGLVRANEEFCEWLCGQKTMPFGNNNRHIPIHLIDFDNINNNKFIITNQYRVHQREVKIPDIVLLINGIPVVVGELKTPIRPSVSWLDGAHEIHNIYENSIPQLFVSNILSFATEGKQLSYGAVRCPLEFWSPWRLEDNRDGITELFGLNDVGNEVSDLLNPKRLLDILQNFTLFSTDRKKRRIKIICRYQQYEGANKIVQRVKNGNIKKGLIWHFQGSGKSLLMVFAAQKLRRIPELKSPTVLVLVDRTDLDTQIFGTFSASDIANVESTDSIKELQNLIELDTRKIIISMIHKFRDAKPRMNTRDNIIVLVDEAHRTQEGDLGRQMRAALPNAFLFGLTGTPVNKIDKNTFWAFGSEDDQGGYLSRYTFHDSINDEATRPLHFEPRLVDVHVDKDTLDTKMNIFTDKNDLTKIQADALSKMTAKMSAFLKSPERIEKIVKDIANHFKDKVEPHGFKAMIVTPDRHACILYKEELDKHFSDEISRVVISTSANDSYDFKRKWAMDRSQQEKVVDEFNNAESELKFVIVTSKLLTGFDAPILQTMYLDKSLKDHTLLQAICRTNRLYPNKTFGRIVDYFGVFDDVAMALQHDEKMLNEIITNLSELRDKLPDVIAKTLSHFEGVDRKTEGFEGLQAAQEAINTDEQRDNFAADFKVLSKLWESLSPDKLLNDYTEDYRWLSSIYESVRPASKNIGKLLWGELGVQTTKLIHENIHVGKVHQLQEFILDAEVIEDIFNNPNPDNVNKLQTILIERFRKRGDNPRFKKLSERLEELRDKAERGLITSIEFVKELCKIAKDTLRAEKELENEIQNISPKAALTELFLELKTEETPAVVERIVNDIDNIVKIVRFSGWQKTTSGEREMQKSLRKTLLKYRLHKDQMLFERAYAYVKEYY